MVRIKLILFFLELAEGFSLAKILWDESILQKEQVVPFRRTVVLSLGSPEKPGKNVKYSFVFASKVNE